MLEDNPSRHTNMVAALTLTLDYAQHFCPLYDQPAEADDDWDQMAVHAHLSVVEHGLPDDDVLVGYQSVD
jgi:hypothetical protein